MSNNEDLKQKLRDNLAALEADERGEPWEYKTISESRWMRPAQSGIGLITTLLDVNYHCRPAPKSSVEYWSKPEHVPGPVCWIRGVHGKGEARHPDYRQHLIVGFSGDVAYQTISGGCEPVACSSLFSETRWEYMEHSTDRIHWHPCTVPAPVPEPLHKPHNPAGLTPEQVETEKGYRLLDEDELHLGPYLQEIESRAENNSWYPGNYGNSSEVTYRTLLSREELAKKRRGE